MNTKPLSIAGAVISAAAAVAVNTALHPCRGEMAMKCVHTTQIGTVLLGALAVISIAALFAKRKALRTVLAVLSAVVSAGVFFVPLLGHCGGAMMHCNTHTMPAFRIAGAILFVATILAAAAELLRKEKAAAA